MKTAAQEDTTSHYPMTQDQRESLERDLAAVMESLRCIATLLRACYDDRDPRVWRAGEAYAAAQRLVWALERQAQAAAGGSMA